MGKIIYLRYKPPNMPQSISYNYIHLIFSTKNRQLLIAPEIESALYGYLIGVSNNLECHILQIGGIADHIHILFRLSRKVSLATFVEEIKKSSRNGSRHRETTMAIFTGRVVMALFQ